MMGSSSKNGTVIPVNSQGTFTVSYTIPLDITNLECLIPTFAGGSTGNIYVDNIRLKIQ